MNDWIAPWVLTRLPGFEESSIEPRAFKVVINGKEIIHGKCPLISLEEHGHKPPKESPPEDTLAFLWWNRLRRYSHVLPFLERLQLK